MNDDVKDVVQVKHFICKQDVSGHDGLTYVGHDGERQLYMSEAWAMSPETADKLVDNVVLFHNHQMEPSTFGGQVVRWWYSRAKSADDNWRVILLIAADTRYIGRQWPNEYHATGPMSRLIEEEFV